MSKPKIKHDKVLAGCRVTVEEYAALNIAAKNNNRSVAGEIRSRLFPKPIHKLYQVGDMGESSFKK